MRLSPLPALGWTLALAAQALLLQATAMGFGSGVAWGIDLEGPRATLGLSQEERPSVVVALGRCK
jgi:nitroreductase